MDGDSPTKFPTWLHWLADFSVVDNQHSSWVRLVDHFLRFLLFLPFFRRPDVGTKPPLNHHRVVGPSLQNPSGPSLALR